jgi:hypothetical protein
MRLSLFTQWERPLVYVKRVYQPQPESESRANVQKVIRERVRAHSLCRPLPPTEKAEYKLTGLYLCSEGKEVSYLQQQTADNTNRSKPLVP